MQKTQALTALSAMANDQRLDLLRLLVPAGPDGLAAGEIARALGLSASRLSFHLAQLEQAGLVRSRKVARNVFYAADASTIGGVIGFVLHDCCQGHPEVRACCQAGDRAADLTVAAPES